MKKTFLYFSFITISFFSVAYADPNNKPFLTEKDEFTFNPSRKLTNSYFPGICRPLSLSHSYSTWHQKFLGSGRSSPRLWLVAGALGTAAGIITYLNGMDTVDEPTRDFPVEMKKGKFFSWWKKGNDDNGSLKEPFVAYAADQLSQSEVLKETRKTKHILVIDGGGIRGVIPGRILHRVEKELATKFGRRVGIAEHFDLIAGTSTGGIIALGLNVPDRKIPLKPRYTALDLVDLYNEHGHRIFPQTNLYERARSFVAPKFSVDPLEDILRKYFERERLSRSLSKVYVTGYEIRKDRPDFFRSYDTVQKDPLQNQRVGFSKKKDLHNNFLMRDVARATSAAPTYFEGAQIFDAEGRECHYVDGGVAVNNPTLAAILEARRIFSDDVNHYVIVSVGTGETPSQDYWEKIKRGGLLNWAPLIADLMMKGAAHLVDDEVHALKDELNRQGIRVDYVRIQPKLPLEQMALDRPDRNNLQKLMIEADKAFEDRENYSKLMKIIQGVWEKEQEKEKRYSKMIEEDQKEGYRKLGVLRLKQGKVGEARKLLISAIDRKDQKASYIYAKICEDKLVRWEGGEISPDMEAWFEDLQSQDPERDSLFNLNLKEGLFHAFIRGRMDYQSAANNHTESPLSRHLQIKSQYRLYKFCEKFIEKQCKNANDNNVEACREGIKRAISKTWKIANEFLNEVAKKGNYHKAQFTLAKRAQEQGNLRKARKYFEKAASQNNMKAQYEFALILEQEGNLTEAEKLYKRAAFQDHTEAKHELSIILREKAKIEKNIDKATEHKEASLYYLRSAANDGFAQAEFEMGQYCEALHWQKWFAWARNSEEFKQAKEWYQLAAGHGHQEAKQKL